jgi:hypothetical protein
MLSEGRLELPNLCKVVATMQTNITLGIVEDDTFFIRKDRMFITYYSRTEKGLRHTFDTILLSWQAFTQG